MAIQTEKWNILLSAFDGWQTSRDSDDIGDSKSPDLLNVRVNGSHFRGALGYSLSGTRNSSAGEISSQYTYKRNDGKKVMVRVRDTGSAGILEWYDATNEDWYTLLSGLTTGKKMGFAEFNTSSTNQMICCNGVENMSVWTGATTRLTAAASGSSDTLSVASTADFPSSGTIIYNGTEKAYDSKTDTSFHATTGNWHASAGADDGVAQAIDDSTHSSITKGNILLSAKDRLWIAGQPAAPNNLDYSDEGAAFTFTGGANRADSGTEDFFNIGGFISGLAEKGDEIVVLGPDGGDGFSFTYPTSTTKAPVFRELFRQVGRGPISYKSVFKIENEVYWAGRNGIVALSDLEGTEKVIDRSISRDILPSIRAYDFSEAAAVYHEAESILLVSCKSDPDYPGNDLVIGVEFYRDKEGNDVFGFTKFDWPVNDFAILENSDNIPELFFGSSLEQNSFKGFDTYQNDGAPRRIKYAIKRFNFDDPFQGKGSRLAAVRGFIKDGTDIDVKILYNAGFLGEQTKTIESSGAYVSQSVLNSIGAFSLGTNPIGSTLEEVSELKEFIVYLDLGVDYVWNDIQLIFESDTDGGTFLVSHVGFAVDGEGFASVDNLTI
jgi:hypothetical protein